MHPVPEDLETMHPVPEDLETMHPVPEDLETIPPVPENTVTIDEDPEEQPAKLYWHSVRSISALLWVALLCVVPIVIIPTVFKHLRTDVGVGLGCATVWTAALVFCMVTSKFGDEPTEKEFHKEHKWPLKIYLYFTLNFLTMAVESLNTLTRPPTTCVDENISKLHTALALIFNITTMIGIIVFIVHQRKKGAVTGNRQFHETVNLVLLSFGNSVMGKTVKPFPWWAGFLVQLAWLIIGLVLQMWVSATPPYADDFMAWIRKKYFRTAPSN